jgi:DME family drug/metabolite transporter
VTMAGLRWISRSGAGDPGLSIVVIGNLFAFLIALPMALPVTRFTGGDFTAVLYLGVIQIGLAYWCLTKGIKQVPAFETSTLILLEPALNPVWTWWLHGERPSPGGLAGGGVILGATLLHTWWQRGAERVHNRTS